MCNQRPFAYGYPCGVECNDRIGWPALSGEAFGVFCGRQDGHELKLSNFLRGAPSLDAGQELPR